MDVPIFKHELQVKRNRGAHVQILLGALKSGRNGADVIGVEGNVSEFKVSLVICLGALAVTGHGILNLHRGAWDDTSRGVNDGSANGSGIRLGEQCRSVPETKDGKSA